MIQSVGHQMNQVETSVVFSLRVLKHWAATLGGLYMAWLWGILSSMGWVAILGFIVLLIVLLKDKTKREWRTALSTVWSMRLEERVRPVSDMLTYRFVTGVLFVLSISAFWMHDLFLWHGVFAAIACIWCGRLAWKAEALAIEKWEKALAETQ
jgi:Trk-type K+ transport system membrane component